jgi:diguanylate cyclase (GGDEF)-like protein
VTIRSRLVCAFCSVPVLITVVAVGVYFQLAPANPIWIGTCVVLIYLLIGLLVIRAVTAPLASLETQTAAAARGDLSRRITYRGHKELASLSDEINRLIGRAENAVREIAELQETIRNYEQELERERSLREEQVTKRSRDLMTKTELAAKDELTGLVNRREALQQFRQLWIEKNRSGSMLACILLDIDHFKSCNDSYGHAVGDGVLKKVAGVLREHARAFDTVCRVGGEEFLVLCRQGGASGAAECAEHLRRAVERQVFQAGDVKLHVTISLGVAEQTETMKEPGELLNLADECLYAAKRTGRNRVVVAPSTTAEGIVKSSAKKDLGRFRYETPEMVQNAPLRVLIAEGNEDLRGQWATALANQGMEVVQAENGPAAMQLARAKRHDALLLSHSLPEMPGLECVRLLRAAEATRDVPAILVANAEAPPPLDEVLEAGADDLMIDPVDSSAMSFRIKSLARIYRSKLELIRINTTHQEQKLSVSKLFAFSRSLSQAHTLNEVLDRTLAITTELTHVQRAGLMLPNRQQAHWVIARSTGIDAEGAAAIQIPMAGATSIKISQRHRPLVAHTKEDVEREGLGPVAVLFTELPVVFSTLSAQSQTLAMLCVGQRIGDRSFTWQELEYLDQISNMAASAIADIFSRKARDEARDAVVEALGTLAEYRDDNTGHHLIRVTQYSLLLAGTLRPLDEFKDQIDEQFLSDLIRAVPLHDIGKVGVPDRILLKNCNLTPEERAIMRKHVDIGVGTLQSVRNRVPEAGYLSMAQDIAAGHHEWYNGAGYPNGLKGAKIPLAARIVALADVYDAITSERPYKPAYRHADAAQMIYENSGAQFDPAVVEAFRKQAGQFARLAESLCDQGSKEFGDPFMAIAQGGEPNPVEESVEEYELAPLQ